jgi:hypothetical protein
MLYTGSNFINAVLLNITFQLVMNVFVYEAEIRMRRWRLKEERKSEENFSLHKHSKAREKAF